MNHPVVQHYIFFWQKAVLRNKKHVFAMKQILNENIQITQAVLLRLYYVAFHYDTTNFFFNVTMGHHFLLQF